MGWSTALLLYALRREYKDLKFRYRFEDLSPAERESLEMRMGELQREIRELSEKLRSGRGREAGV